MIALVYNHREKRRNQRKETYQPEKNIYIYIYLFIYLFMLIKTRDFCGQYGRGRRRPINKGQRNRKR
jgi:hypothetical protein